MFFVGIDWANDHHDVCVLNESGEKKQQLRVEHDLEGFSLLRKTIEELCLDPQEVEVCLEKSHGLLVDFLLSCGFKVYPINPKSADRMRDRHSVSCKKDDQLDAFVLADALRTDRHRLRPLTQDSSLARELKVLVSDREHLVQSKTRVTNQMSACLKEYYPLGLEVFGSLQSMTTLDFLERYPSIDELRTMGLQEFTDFLNQHQYPFKTLKKTPEGFYEEIKKHKLWLKADPVVVKTKSRFLQALISQLKTLTLQVKAYDQAIEDLMNQHPDNDLFLSLPGAGKTLSAKIAAHFGQDRSRFQSFEAVQRLAGTAPITQRSGNYLHVKRRRACQTEFLTALLQFSFSSLKGCLWAKRYYQEKKKAGSTHAGALRALANKWVKIIFALWKNNTTYDENVFLASKQQQLLLNAA